jgi:hypothetical protein
MVCPNIIPLLLLMKIGLIFVCALTAWVILQNIDNFEFFPHLVLFVRDFPNSFPHRLQDQFWIVFELLC